MPRRCRSLHRPLSAGRRAPKGLKAVAEPPRCRRLSPGFPIIRGSPRCTLLRALCVKSQTPHALYDLVLRIEQQGCDDICLLFYTRPTLDGGHGGRVGACPGVMLGSANTPHNACVIGTPPRLFAATPCANTQTGESPLWLPHARYLLPLRTPRPVP